MSLCIQLPLGPVNGFLICWSILTVEDKRYEEFYKNLPLSGGKHTNAYTEEKTAECFHPLFNRQPPNYFFHTQTHVKIAFNEIAVYRVPKQN